MRKAYISISQANVKALAKELDTIKETLSAFSFEPFVFCEKYNFFKEEEVSMMLQAVRDLTECDLLIAETSQKGIGIGIEVGLAKAKNKPVIYIRQKYAEHSTTVSGISDFRVIYETNADLRNQLSEILTSLV